MSTSIIVESPRSPIPVRNKSKTPPDHTFRHGPGMLLATHDSPTRSAMVGSSACETMSLELQSLPQAQLSDAPTAGTADQMQTIWEPFKNRFRVLAACFTALANGMNDSANGALIESMER